ncbi:MAG: DUF2971 domain-containing protein [Candidatus Gastranaerophilaceae bacterium]
MQKSTQKINNELFDKHIMAIYKIMPDYELPIYHYTSPKACIKILETKKLRFTHIDYLNDASEVKYTYELLLDCIAMLKKSDGESSFYNIISDDAKLFCCEDESYRYGSTLKVNNFSYFIASFSLDMDNLSLWNYYTKNSDMLGYNIEFESGISLLKKNKYIHTFAGGHVIYDIHIQKSLILKALKDYKKYYDKTKVKSTKLSFCKGFMRTIQIFTLYFKHPAFTNENEFRIIIAYNTNADKNNFLFREQNGIFIPYIELEFETKNVCSVTIYPSQKQSIAASGLQKLLNLNDYLDTEIKISKIPLRF